MLVSMTTLTTSILSLSASLALALAGCMAGSAPPPDDDDGDGDGNGDGDGTGGGFGPRDFIASFALEECQHAHSCRNEFPPDAGVTFEQAFGADIAMCEAMALQFYQPDVVRDSVNAGRILYNQSQAAACIGTIDFGTCAQYFGGTSQLPAACDQALVGQIPDGQQCNHDLECSSPTSWCGDTQVCEPFQQ
jgi:hypothetical protein